MELEFQSPFELMTIRNQMRFGLREIQKIRIYFGMQEFRILPCGQPKFEFLRREQHDATNTVRPKENQLETRKFFESQEQSDQATMESGMAEVMTQTQPLTERAGVC